MDSQCGHWRLNPSSVAIACGFWDKPIGFWEPQSYRL